MSSPELYTLSLHDALPIFPRQFRAPRAPLPDPGHGSPRHTASSMPVNRAARARKPLIRMTPGQARSEEHTSELQSHSELVCRLLLEKKNDKGGVCVPLVDE